MQGGGPLVIDVGVKDGHDFIVKPYNVTISELSSQLRLGETGEFVLRAVDDQGQPAPAGMAFQVFAEGLIISQQSALTDAQGTARVAYQAGFLPIDVQVKASVGYTDATTQTVSITNQNATGVSAVGLENLLLIGDRQSSGTIEYERYDGVDLGLPYATEQQVVLNGTPGSTLALSLGNPDRPNVSPIVAYTMSDEGEADDMPLGKDAVGRHDAIVKASGVLSNSDAQTAPLRVNHYRGQAGDSAVFDGRYYLESGIPVDLISADAIAFRLDTFIDDSSTGELLALGDDALLSLSVDENQSLILRVNGADEQGLNASNSASLLTTSPLTEGWHSVAMVLSEGQLALYLDGTQQHRVALDALNVPVPSVDVSEPTMTLAIGKRFVGALDNVELYNPQSAPLLRFSDTEGVTGEHNERLEIIFDSSGTRVVMVQSTGQLNSQSGSALVTRSIVLESDAGTQDFINLLSLDSYTALAGMYATTLYDGTELPGIDPNGLDSAAWHPANPAGTAVAAVGDYIFTPAHAFFGLDRSRFLSGLSTLASLVLPINEIKEIWVQMAYLATDPAKFEAGELVINVISLATYFPALRPLQPVLRPLKRFYKRFGDKALHQGNRWRAG